MEGDHISLRFDSHHLRHQTSLLRNLGQEPYPELELGRHGGSAYDPRNPDLPYPNPGDLGPIRGPVRPHSPAGEASAQRAIEV